MNICGGVYLQRVKVKLNNKSCVPVGFVCLGVYVLLLMYLFIRS